MSPLVQWTIAIHRTKLDGTITVHSVSCGICGGQSDTGAGFRRVLRFPLSVRIPPLLHSHRLSFGAGTIGQTVVAAPSGLSLTPWENIIKNTWLSYFISYLPAKPDYKLRTLSLEVLGPRHRLYWLRFFMVFLSSSRRMPKKYLD
jgi:hypothetical protein